MKAGKQLRGGRLAGGFARTIIVRVRSLVFVARRHSARSWASMRTAVTVALLLASTGAFSPSARRGQRGGIESGQ